MKATSFTADLFDSSMYNTLRERQKTIDSHTISPDYYCSVGDNSVTIFPGFPFTGLCSSYAIPALEWFLDGVPYKWIKANDGTIVK